MKKTFKIQVLILGLIMSAFSAGAQEESPETLVSVIPKYVSDKGYWVVEGNINNKQEHTIHFYTNEHFKVYQETIIGRLKIHKRKTLMHIKRMLDTAVVAWQQKKPVSENLFAATK